MSSQAIAKCPARKIFSPLFKSRWQNMQNIVTDSVYINKIPAAYKTYYIAYINQWKAWARGFVLQLHQNDFFSTGIGYTVCDTMTRMCMSGGFRLHATDEKTQAFIEKWCEDDLNNVFNKMFFEANAGGNALLCLTPVDGDLYPSVIPINRAVFEIGRTGRISRCMILNRFVAGDTAYYTREMRMTVDGEAYWRVQIAEGTLITSPSWGENWQRNVPEIVRTQWEYSYGHIQPNVWYKMPERLRGVGVYNVKNKSVASAISDIPGYSDSTLHTCLDICYSIDYNFTQSQVDQYMGKSFVMIPKQMSGRTIQGRPGTLTEGKTFREAMDTLEQAPLDDQFFTQVGDYTVDGKPIQPLFIQPDLREGAHRAIRDSDIELLASKVGISAGTLASHLAGGGTKTDDQINAETSMDEKTVGNKRMLANRAINAMLSDVAHFYGYDDDVTVQWGRSTANSARENEELANDYRMGTLTAREYLRRRWPDMSEEEIEKLAAEVEEQKKQENTMFGGDDLNGYGEPPAESAGDDPRRGGERDPGGSEG